MHRPCTANHNRGLHEFIGKSKRSKIPDLFMARGVRAQGVVHVNCNLQVRLRQKAIDCS